MNVAMNRQEAQPARGSPFPWLRALTAHRVGLGFRLAYASYADFFNSCCFTIVVTASLCIVKKIAAIALVAVDQISRIIRSYTCVLVIPRIP